MLAGKYIRQSFYLHDINDLKISFVKMLFVKIVYLDNPRLIYDLKFLESCSESIKQ